MIEDISFWSSPIDWLSSISFESKPRLWWLIAVAVLIVAYVLLQFRRSRYAVRFTNVELLDKVAPDRPGWRRHLPAFFFLLSLVGLVTAYAEPIREGVQEIEQATVILAIDTSLSMQARDVDPSRIEGAKTAALEFVDDLPREIYVGLVSFNGVPSLRVPPTNNRAAVRSAISNLELGEATAIGEAVFTSLDAIDDFFTTFDGAAPPAIIVLMSDGETTVGRPDELAIEAARADAIPVSVIAFGTQRGSITLPESPAPINVPVNEEALANIADGTGGEFFSAQTTDELRAAYEDLELARTEVVDILPVADKFIAPSLLLLAIGALLSLLWFQRLP